MALITCDECGHRISDKSIFCPSCGYPTHLNKALRENCPADSHDGSASVSDTVKEAAPKSEMSDKAVEKILTQSPSQHASDNETAAITDLERKESAATAAEEAAIESIDTDATEQVEDALAEYEATLSKPITPENNKRNKLILYFAVLLALLLAIGGCYYYAKSNHLQSVDEVECEPIEEVLEEEVSPAMPADTTAAPADTINRPSTATTAQPSTANAQPAAANAASQPVDTPAQPAAPEVQQSPAVRQL